ncbi:MAG: hypothetical protein N2559_10870 [Anaerolineae bacterium]|nr:hypothetical protein [Anaerolineae bacterium]
MHLVHPDYLMGDTPLPSIAVRAYAQVLCEDFAQRIGVPAPRVIVSNHSTVGAQVCRSPIKHWARWTREGNLTLASFPFNPLLLQFAIGHAMAHHIYGLEWQCDLEALDWMNDPAVPLVESTARVIAQTMAWRERVPHSELGMRVLMIGDALTSQIW